MGFELAQVAELALVIFDWVSSAAIIAQAQAPPTPSVPVTSNPANQVIEIAKLLLLAIPGYLAARLQAKKERQTADSMRDDRLAAGWQSMSTQAREQLTRAYEDLAKEREIRKAVETRVEELEQELEELRKRPQKRAPRENSKTGEGTC